jgi:hypothetical protein
MIVEDFFKNGRLTIQGEITKNVKQGICRCEITNSQGTCCLGDVTRTYDKKYKITSLKHEQDKLAGRFNNLQELLLITK